MLLLWERRRASVKRRLVRSDSFLAQEQARSAKLESPRAMVAHGRQHGHGGGRVRSKSGGRQVCIALRDGDLSLHFDNCDKLLFAASACPRTPHTFSRQCHRVPYGKPSPQPLHRQRGTRLRSTELRGCDHVQRRRASHALPGRFACAGLCGCRSHRWPVHAKAGVVLLAGVSSTCFDFNTNRRSILFCTCFLKSDVVGAV